MENIKNLFKGSKILKKAEVVDEGKDYVEFQLDKGDCVFSIVISLDAVDGVVGYAVDASIHEICSEDVELNNDVCQELDLSSLYESFMEEDLVEIIEDYIVNNESVYNYKRANKLFSKILKEDEETIAILQSLLENVEY